MPENLHLVTELAIIMIAAGVFTVISKALKQPSILGYIIAGFLVGPHLGLFPQFGADSIKEWSELGIIFLLFGLGLEFSFKKLLKIGSNALIMAGVICVGMFCVGIFVGHLMGWTPMESIFLGGMTGMSSTTIIIKAFGDMGLKERPYAPLVFGVLVFEDLIAVLLMVLLSTLAMTGKFSGVEMLMGLAKLVFFLILWFLVGMYLIPILLKKSRQYLNDEIILLVGLGLCFMMVVLANLAGFSSALGAFVMGSILAETIEGQKIEQVTGNIKDMFGAIFFVSVGMMVDPAVIAQQWLPIIIIAITAICGILLFSTAGALLAGQGLNNAVHAGFSLAQLGEFAFIIAGLGCSLGVLRDFIYPVVVTVSVITTFTTPFLIKLGDPVSDWLDRKLPVKVLAFLNPKKQEGTKSKAEQNEWARLLKIYFLRLALYGVILVAVMVTCNMYLDKILTRTLPNGISPVARNWIDFGITLALMAPFLFGIVVSGVGVRKSADILLRNNPSNRWPLTALICLRAVLATIAIMSTVAEHFRIEWWASLILLVLGTGIFVFFAFRATSRISHLETTFLENLNTKEEMERRASPVASKVREMLAGFDVNIYSATISPDFLYIGKTLREMPFRKTSGINIIKIVRGSHSIVVPSGSEIIYPGDVLLAVGTGKQLAKFREIIKVNTPSGPKQEENFTVEAVAVRPESILAGHTLHELEMRKNGCMIVSMLDKDGTIRTNPSSEQVIEPGDVVWIAGEKSSVEWYK